MIIQEILLSGWCWDIFFEADSAALSNCQIGEQLAQRKSMQIDTEIIKLMQKHALAVIKRLKKLARWGWQVRTTQAALSCWSAELQCHQQ
ncbi:MAG: hypothetical protein ACYC0M_10635 [Burkholderiales bacterium]